MISVMELTRTRVDNKSTSYSLQVGRIFLPRKFKMILACVDIKYLGGRKYILQYIDKRKEEG
jgi:hypothetical protein